MLTASSLTHSPTSSVLISHHFLPCKISVQAAMASPMIPSADVKAMLRVDKRNAVHKRVSKDWDKCFVEPLGTFFLQNFHFSALSNFYNACQVPCSDLHHCWRWHKFSVMQAYQRIPMETAGAYRLIDDETGENVIVWGGTESDSPIPSKEAISRKSVDNPEQGGRKIMPSSADSAESCLNFVREEESIDMLSDGKMKGSSVPNAVNDAHTSSRLSKTDRGSMQSIDTSRKKYHKTMRYDSGFFSRKSFRDLGCSDYMIESLRKQSFIYPSNIQAMAFRPVLEGRSCIIADQSGSGKTLAYIAPVVQRLREEELSGLEDRNLRVAILSPTSELASQVLQNCRSMSKSGVPFRSAVATGGFRQKTQLEALQQGLDVLIATPGRFMFLLQEGYIQLNNLKWNTANYDACSVILDEVDILLGDKDFEPVLQSFIRLAPMTVQYLFVTATLPVDIYKKLVEDFPDTEVVMGPGMHRTSSRLNEVVLDCSGKEGEEKNSDTAFLNKKTALLQLVEESPVPRTIVFCNKMETCRKVENALKRFDRKGFQLKVLPFHAALTQELRLSNMEEFLKSESKQSMFLISTDRASRGIDFANVDHVLLFDFPREPSEYVRRVGRTARGAGGKGSAFVFAVGKQVSMARRIIERNIKRHPLHPVPDAYELHKHFC